MLTPIYRILSIATILSIVFTLSANQPAAAFDIDPEAVHYIVPTGEWLGLQAGERHLYQFSYDSFKQSNGQLSDAVITVKMSDRRSVRFSVYTSNDIPSWERGGEIKSMGMGTELGKLTAVRSDRTTHVWESSDVRSQDYYVIVENTRPVPSYYEIEITGAGVSFPESAEVMAEKAVAEEAVEEVAVAPEVVPAPAAEEVALVEVVMEESAALEVVEEAAALEVTEPISATGGTGPGDALAPADGYVTLAPGESRWYGFDYYTDFGKSPSEAKILVKIPVEGSIGFDVLGKNEIASWERGEKFSPLGAGTPIDYGKDFPKDPNILSWVGRSEDGGRYYVIVKNRSDQTAGFSISITGETVGY